MIKNSFSMQNLKEESKINVIGYKY